METNFKIYEEFTPELREIWQKHYLNVKGAYNSSYEWCETWFKHFGRGKKPFVITIWAEENLKALAPFYKKDNRLYAIGSCPDFYDELPLLYEGDEYLFELVNYIFERGFALDLKFIPSDSALLKYFIRKCDQESIYKTTLYDYTVVPVIYKDKDFDPMLAKIYKKYLKKRRNMAENKYHDELGYNFSCEKDEKYLNEFISLHRTKWATFKSEPLQGFIKDLFLNNEHTILSRLYFRKSNTTLAYSYSYLCPNNKVYFSMCSVNNGFMPIAPGFFITYNDLTDTDVPEVVTQFEFGRGGGSYKYSFTNKERLVVCLRADLTWKRHKVIFEPLKKLKQRLFTGH